jgi:hypothetical protein
MVHIKSELFGFPLDDKGEKYQMGVFVTGSYQGELDSVLSGYPGGFDEVRVPAVDGQPDLDVRKGFSHQGITNADIYVVAMQDSDAVLVLAVDPNRSSRQVNGDLEDAVKYTFGRTRLTQADVWRKGSESHQTLLTGFIASRCYLPEGESVSTP